MFDQIAAAGNLDQLDAEGLQAFVLSPGLLFVERPPPWRSQRPARSPAAPKAVFPMEGHIRDVAVEA